MPISERVTFLLKVDARGVVKEFDKVGRGADRSLGKAESRIDRMGARFTKVGAGMVGAAGLMGAALASTIGPASDLAEAMNVNTLVFPDSAKAMEDWADTAATAFGQSKRQALESAAAIGGLLKNVGFLEDDAADLSKDLVELASDMGSAFNTDPADALEAIRSGLSGSSEPLRRYNVFLSEAAIQSKALELGIIDAGEAMDENAKAQARLAIITEQTADIQGDFAATADGAANSQRVLAAQMEDLKASIGTAVLPVFQELTGLANDLLGLWNSLNPETQALVSKALLLGTAITALAGGASLLVGKAIKAREALLSLRGGMTRTQLATGLLTGAIAGGFLVWDAHRKRVERNKQTIEGFADALEGASDEAKAIRGEMSDLADENETIRDVFADIEREAPGTLSRIAAELAETGRISQATSDDLRALGVSAFEVTALTRLLEGGVEGARDKIADMGAIVEEVQPAFLELQGAAQISQQSFSDIGTEAKFGADQVRIFSGEVANTIDPLGGMDDLLGRVTSKLEGYFSAADDGFDSVTAQEGAIDDLNDAFKRNGVTLDANTKKGRENRRAYSQLRKEIADTVTETFEQTGSLEEAVAAGEALVANYAEQAGEANLAEQAIGEVVAQLEDFPEEVVTDMKAEEGDTVDILEHIQGLMQWINATPVTVRVGIPGVAQQSVPVVPNVPTGQISPEELDFITRSQGPSRGVTVGSGGASGTVVGVSAPPVQVIIGGEEITDFVVRDSNRRGGVPLKIANARG